LYFLDIWYSSWKFGIFFVLVLCAEKIWQPSSELFSVAGAPSLPKTFFSRPEVQQEVESKVSPFDKFRNLDQQATQQNTAYAPG
jgi:hypothetical protein